MGAMATKQVSAALLMYRVREGNLEVFLAHPGGPFFAKKDEGAWTLPKGLAEEGEDLETAARREFEEETGIRPRGPFIPLGTVKLTSGKTIHAWAFAGDRDPGRPLASNTFEIEWPPRSGRRQEFPEIDRAAFFSPEEAAKKLNPQQAAFVSRLIEALGRGPRLRCPRAAR